MSQAIPILIIGLMKVDAGIALLLKMPFEMHRMEAGLAMRLGELHLMNGSTVVEMLDRE